MNTNQGKLWGGRFAGRTEPRARGAVAVDALRLAAGPVRPRRFPRARPRAPPGRPARPTTSSPGCSTDSTSSTAGSVEGELLPQARDEDVHGALEGRPRRAGRCRPRRQAARRPQSQRPDRHAVQGLPARPRPGDRRDRPRPRRRHRRSGRGAPRRDHAGAHAPPARAAGAAQPPPDGPCLAAGPGRLAAARLGRPGRGRLAVRLWCTRRLQPRPRPRGRGARPRLHRQHGQLDRRYGGPRLRRRVRLRDRDDRRRREPAGRGDHPLGHPGVRLRGARRRVTPPGRASCRRRRTPTSPSSPAARPAG